MKSPNALFVMSCEEAMRENRWFKDPGDNLDMASDPFYGVDQSDGFTSHIDDFDTEPDAFQDEIEDGIQMNTDEEIKHAQQALAGFDFNFDDNNWGIPTYTQAVLCMATVYPAKAAEALQGGFV